MNCTGENFIVASWFVTEQKPDQVCATRSVRRELWRKIESTEREGKLWTIKSSEASD